MDIILFWPQKSLNKREHYCTYASEKQKVKFRRKVTLPSVEACRTVKEGNRRAGRKPEESRVCMGKGGEEALVQGE